MENQEKQKVDEVQVSRRIWETTYIHSLTFTDPVTASKLAEDAIDLYLSRWTPRSAHLDTTDPYHRIHEMEQGLA